MKNVALVTGASSGIGRELAKLHAQKGGDLVVVARNQEQLGRLKYEFESEYAISVKAIVADLSIPSAAQAIYAITNSSGISVDVLINNAGFGGHGKFHERKLLKDEAMIRLNIVTLTALTHLYLPHMIEQGQGRILNIASTAGFLPGPLQSVYYASKAYVLSFTQAIAEELHGTGVTVTALCPGPVNTNFVEAAKLEGVKAFDNAASAESVAKYGYKAMQMGKLVAINDGGLRFLLNWIMPLLPRKTVLKMSRKAMEKTL